MCSPKSYCYRDSEVFKRFAIAILNRRIRKFTVIRLDIVLLGMLHSLYTIL